MVKDISALPDPPEVVRRLQAEGIRSYIMIPLVVQDELIGSLNLGATEPGSFGQEQIEIAREVADSLAVAIQQAHLHEEVRRHAEELERRVAERTARLEAANQELEAFVYSVSHDLRAPLRAMEGFAQALLEDYADCLDEQGRDYARRIVAAAQRMDGLIEDLLQYSRLSRMHVEFHPVSLEQVISSVLTQLEGEIRAREAEVEVVPPFPEVLGHRLILEQVLGNLLSNALKFVPKEVRPHVRLWAEPRKPWVRIWWRTTASASRPNTSDASSASSNDSTVWRPIPERASVWPSYKRASNASVAVAAWNRRWAKAAVFGWS